jgi:hypothetical protein
VLAGLSSTPTSASQWATWSWDHKDHHTLIQQTILTRTGTNLQIFPLDPIPFAEIHRWLEWNQRAHNDINGSLGTQSSDLQQVDITNPQQLQAWIYLHRREHESWSAFLKV